MVDAQLNNEGADESIPQFTPEKGIIPPNPNIQQMETALRELLERQTRKAEIASEAMKRAETMAARQQALLEEAEKRDQELKQKLQNRLSYNDDDEGVRDSRSRTWKPSVAAGNPPAKENNKHPFSLAILSEELPKNSNAVKCKAFTVTLKKDTLTWFNSLSPGSMKSFSELSSKFK
ncbi:hypothetical protein PIB30_054718 [Stylosanthes scabra]|uniref:Uncharacterized protein n=1 Tax=Stylosanthes scabra TaxID=79078 RepID=A0ABU6ZHJ5_9FABA|nr:hypothetical protein [Stylosanthes scabra]